MAAVAALAAVTAGHPYGRQSWWSLVRVVVLVQTRLQLQQSPLSVLLIIITIIITISATVYAQQLSQQQQHREQSTDDQ